MTDLSGRHLELHNSLCRISRRTFRITDNSGRYFELVIVAADILDNTTFCVESFGGHFELEIIAADILNYIGHLEFQVPYWHMQIRVITSIFIMERGRGREGARP